MSSFTKADLKYHDYKWTAYNGDDPQITGEPDGTLFSRNEGYEVLYLINKLASNENLLQKETKLKQKESGTKIEKMIREKLPTNILKQSGVVIWIIKNWKEYYI